VHTIDKLKTNKAQSHAQAQQIIAIILLA